MRPQHESQEIAKIRYCRHSVMAIAGILLWHPRNKAQDVPLFADLPPTPPDRKLLRADSATEWLIIEWVGMIAKGRACAVFSSLVFGSDIIACAVPRGEGKKIPINWTNT